MVNPVWFAVSGAVVKSGLQILGSKWTAMGGGAIAFNSLKTLVFGKTLKTLEYPNGDMHMINVRMLMPWKVKKSIARVQNDVSAEEIKQLSSWHNHYFTEPLNTMGSMRLLSDNDWLLWSRSSTPIPRKGVTISSMEIGYKAKVADMDDVIRFVSNLSKEGALTKEQTDHVVDLALASDDALRLLFHSFESSPTAFTHHVLRLLSKRGVIQYPSPPSITTEEKDKKEEEEEKDEKEAREYVKKLRDEM